MSDLISRQSAIDLLRAYLVGKRCPDDGTLTCRLIENEVVNKLPPIQPEIIYCKDCGYRDDYGCCKYWKALAIGDIPIATDDNDFCSHAERRNDVFVER